jgi:hypothetical protein
MLLIVIENGAKMVLIHFNILIKMFFKEQVNSLIIVSNLFINRKRIIKAWFYTVTSHPSD